MVMIKVSYGDDKDIVVMIKISYGDDKGQLW